jgi:hypothetical protein
MVEDILERDETSVDIYLTCINCGIIEVVKVPSERKLPPKVYWECMECTVEDHQATCKFRLLPAEGKWALTAAAG